MPVVKPVVVPSVETEKKTTAQLTIKAPLNLTVSVEGQAINRSSSEMTFKSPTLEAGKSYIYDFKAEGTVDGKKVSLTKQVTIRAGQESVVAFDATVNADAPSRITVKIPAKAKLYVDGVLCPQDTETRSFETPKLVAGRSYFYEMRAELEHEGQMLTETKKVTLEAGKPVSVEFGTLTSVVTTARR